MKTSSFATLAVLLLALVLTGPLAAGGSLELLGVPAAQGAPAAPPPVPVATVPFSEKAVDGAVVLFGKWNLPADVTPRVLAMYRRDLGLLGSITVNEWLDLRPTDGRFRVQIAATKYRTLHEVPLHTVKIWFTSPGYKKAHMLTTTTREGGFINSHSELELVKKVIISKRAGEGQRDPQMHVTPIWHNDSVISAMAFLMSGVSGWCYRLDMEDGGILRPQQSAAR